MRALFLVLAALTALSGNAFAQAGPGPAPPASGGITALTGGVTATGPGSAAATVVTNANLTGPVTSSGNATAIASSIALPGSPTTTTQSALTNNTTISTTAYTDAAVAAALAATNPAIAVQAATTTAGNTSGLTYTHVAGIGDFFTGTTNTAITWDGFTFTALGQRGLIKNDTQSPSGAFNGVYYITQVQTAIVPPILTRALDYNQPSDINNTGAIPVVNGTLNASTSWLLTSAVATVGTDPLTYTQFSIAPSTLVVGPASAGSGNLASYNGTTGKLIQDSGVASNNVVTLSGASQPLTGGFLPTDGNDGTKSSGTYTPLCGAGPQRYITNGGAFTLAAPAASSNCYIQITNNGSAGAVTFSGFTVGTNTGAALDTTNGHLFLVSIVRLNGKSMYSIFAYQ